MAKLIEMKGVNGLVSETLARFHRIPGIAGGYIKVVEQYVYDSASPNQAGAVPDLQVGLTTDIVNAYSESLGGTLYLLIEYSVDPFNANRAKVNPTPPLSGLDMRNISVFFDEVDTFFLRVASSIGENMARVTMAEAPLQTVITNNANVAWVPTSLFTSAGVVSANPEDFQSMTLASDPDHFIIAIKSVSGKTYESKFYMIPAYEVYNSTSLNPTSGIDLAGFEYTIPFSGLPLIVIPLVGRGPSWASVVNLNIDFSIGVLAPSKVGLFIYNSNGLCNKLLIVSQINAAEIAADTAAGLNTTTKGADQWSPSDRLRQLNFGTNNAAKDSVIVMMHADPAAPAATARYFVVLKSQYAGGVKKTIGQYEVVGFAAAHPNIAAALQVAY